jgi:hypothetical protein
VTREEGGVSHFQMFRDNLRISWMHTRLVALCLLRLAGAQRRQEKLLPP